MEIWGGPECSINRVKNDHFDQLEYTGHYSRESDIDAIAQLGFKKLRYPVLWEKHQPEQNQEIDWSQTEKRLIALHDKGIEVIAGLVHHGSGPCHVNMAGHSFVDGLVAYAAKVARRFPWINWYTPVNEPLTTARFCGLYGIWYPHSNNDQTFCRILLNECKATVLAMQEIRKVNPAAKLLQTDDLGKIHSTPLLKYQADFENERRWITFDLLCGKVTPQHPMWHYLLGSGIGEDELAFFRDNVCGPDIIGFNHYLTSERYLDEDLDTYPPHTHGGNGRYSYADVEAVRVGHIEPDGPYKLLKEAWERFGLPMAITEIHLHCTREEQMRWLKLMWDDARRLQSNGVDIRAITAWSLLGSHGWDRLLTEPNGHYEPGVFELMDSVLRPTALAQMITCYNSGQEFCHPVLHNRGWWQRSCRVVYGNKDHADHLPIKAGEVKPVLIIEKTGTPGDIFARMCELRGITYQTLAIDEFDPSDPSAIENLLLTIEPWAIVNTVGSLANDLMVARSQKSFAINAPGQLAVLCEKHHIKLLTFAADLSFSNADTENIDITLSGMFDETKARAEQNILYTNPTALIIRTSAFFVSSNHTINAQHILISPVFPPDVINRTLDLLLDDEKGIWHLCDRGKITPANAAFAANKRSEAKKASVEPAVLKHLGPNTAISLLAS